MTSTSVMAFKALNRRACNTFASHLQIAGYHRLNQMVGPIKSDSKSNVSTVCRVHKLLHVKGKKLLPLHSWHECKDLGLIIGERHIEGERGTIQISSNQSINEMIHSAEVPRLQLGTCLCCSAQSVYKPRVVIKSCPRRARIFDCYRECAAWSCSW